MQPSYWHACAMYCDVRLQPVMHARQSIVCNRLTAPDDRRCDRRGGRDNDVHLLKSCSKRVHGASTNLLCLHAFAKLLSPGLGTAASDG